MTATQHIQHTFFVRAEGYLGCICAYTRFRTMEINQNCQKERKKKRDESIFLIEIFYSISCVLHARDFVEYRMRYNMCVYRRNMKRLSDKFILNLITVWRKKFWDRYGLEECFMIFRGYFWCSSLVCDDSSECWVGSFSNFTKEIRTNIHYESELENFLWKM